MHEFLDSIASGYVRAVSPGLDSYTFIFPNSRAAKFFRSRLKAYNAPLNDQALKSLCMTMTEMVEKESGRRRASDEELLFELYDTYRALRTDAGEEKNIKSFDRFRFWGQMILQDFNEVDKYMVDPAQIFRNVTEYKEIQALYLTDEQKSIISEFWGDETYWQPQRDADKLKQEDRPFWAHAGGKSNSETVRKFRQLWQLLAPLYAGFRKRLDSEKKCYPGLAYRLAAEKIRTRGLTSRKTFVFIGFNRLSTSEHMIFQALQQAGKAHFYWDYDPVLMDPSTGNPAGRFISRCSAVFTDGIGEVKRPAPRGDRQVDVIAVPSNVGQTKVAATLLTDTTALVLPSNDLLLPMVQAIPERFEDINVTMGYPMRHSALSQLYSLLAALQIRARRTSAGDLLFFRDDVMALLSEPLIQGRYADECRAALAYIKERHLFNLPASLVASAPEFEVFRTLLLPIGAEAPIDEVASYIVMAMDFIGAENLVNDLEKKCVETIKHYVDNLAALAQTHSVDMTSRTFFNLVERNVFQSYIPMEGTGFGAMQVMGVLETRCFGFDHVVMLSMTDSVYPGRYFSRSFIPELLRRAYGLPTRDHAEADSAYHFYRLLSNSRKLTLIYDSRSGGLRSGEMSRYIFQLQYLGINGIKVNMKAAVFNASTTTDVKPYFPQDIEIRKTPEIMERLNRYRDPKLLYSHSLSASTLKGYLNCPLSFYLERVQDLWPPEEDKADVDAGILGNTVHEVAERVYKTLSPDPRKPVTITGKDLEDLMAGGYNDLLDREIRRSLRVNVDMLRRRVPDPDNPDKLIDNPQLDSAPLSDKSENIYFPIIKEYMCRLFNHEYTPFDFIDAEQNVKFHWTGATPAGVAGINFTMKIDRLDSVTDENTGAKITRVVDYKTGSDSLKATDIGSLFKTCESGHPHAIFQLLTYCAAYVDHNNADPALLRPQIFPLKVLEKQGFPLLTINNNKLNNFAEVEAEFRDGLAGMLEELFNPDVPFVRATDDQCCRYCKFYMFCHTTPRDLRKKY